MREYEFTDGFGDIITLQSTPYRTYEGGIDTAMLALEDTGCTSYDSLTLYIPLEKAEEIADSIRDLILNAAKEV